jgi:prepilin-type N-terminal cleavage/methylation domain-containing protein
MKHSDSKINFKNQYQGFTLIEVLVVLIIVGLTSSWAIPSFHRSILQGKVDRYMRNVASGLFSLRARMGAIKGSCLIDFGERSSFSIGEFLAAEQLLERQQLNGTLSTNDALKQCRASYAGDAQVNAEAFRLVNLEGSRERDAVEVALKNQTYSFTPPGTTANANAMTILIRAKGTNTSAGSPISSISKIRTRCVEVSGNGQVFSGTWSQKSNLCVRK